MYKSTCVNRFSNNSGMAANWWTILTFFKAVISRVDLLSNAAYIQQLYNADVLEHIRICVKSDRPIPCVACLCTFRQVRSLSTAEMHAGYIIRM
jgi:hypothetical protein